MEGYDATTYGQSIAGVYDNWHPGVRPEQVELLCHLAGDGPVLELGIGTGRVALPLVSRGLQVHGIDSSEAMLAALQAKPGGEQVAVTVGDFADFDLADRFSLVFVVFNTLFALPDQEAQLACFAAVSRHLLPGSRFLVEAFVPDPGRFDRGQRLSVVNVSADEVRLECSRHDARPRASQLSTFCSAGARRRSTRYKSDTPGLRSWTSWPSSQGFSWRTVGTVGTVGTANRTLPARSRLFRCGRPLPLSAARAGADAARRRVASRLISDPGLGHRCRLQRSGAVSPLDRGRPHGRPEHAGVNHQPGGPTKLGATLDDGRAK